MRYRPALLKSVLLVPILIAAFPVLAFAQEAALDSGDTAWMLTATALVLFMTIPGLSLFYAGLVRSKNALSVLMQCFAITALMSILWAVYGYSLAFADGGGLNAFVGGFGHLFLAGVDREALTGSIPTSVFVTFQMTFAIITPALICGAFAERMKFSAMLWFMGLWLTLVYFPVCHMVWADGGFLLERGVMDFAGGTVVHINAGIAALLAALLIGPRKGFPKTAMPPHNLTMTVTGAGMLWVGWFGFNAGSALSAGADAGMAMLVTQISTAAAALTWMFIEWLKHGKPSALGIVTGAVAGLVAITPASGSAGPMGALAIGILSGIACFLGATTLKRACGYDDSLDAFGVHGVGGLVGAILTGLFAHTALGGAGLERDTLLQQILWQGIGVVLTIVYCGVLTFLILKGVDRVIGLRVSDEQENQGLDLSQHEEQAYQL